MRNIKLTLAYDGTDYVGWQIQPNGVSIQAVVTDALHKLTGEAVTLLTAGRTDSGVHAVGQVASFRTNSRIPIEKFPAGLHNFLPDDIAIREAREVPEDFHATYTAVRKHYRYVIFNHRVRHPFLARYAWRVSQQLDAAAMHLAAQKLLGTHDFRCFESHFPNKATSVRTIAEAAVSRRPDCPVWNAEAGAVSWSPAPAPPEDDFLWFDVVADGFLYNMVRAIVGTLVKVGLGRWAPDDVSRIIAGQDRSQAGETAPPQGLYLMRVDYGDADVVSP